MPITFLLDEHLRGKGLAAPIAAYNAAGHPPIDAVVVGEPPDLPRRTPDPDILRWAERAGRVLVTRDISTVPGHLADHLAAGRHSPGVMAIKKRAVMADLLSYLSTVAHAGDPDAYTDMLVYIPEW